MDRPLLAQLIGELVETPNMLVVIDSASAVAEMHTGSTVRLDLADRWAMIESDEWHVHIDMDDVAGAQFVDAVDRFHQGIPKLYYVRLSDGCDRTLIRFYFPNPWLDDREQPAEFQQEKLDVFEAFRDRYVGRGGIVSATKN
jgi:hypothetical protein